MIIAQAIAAALALQSTPQIEARPYTPPVELKAKSQAQLRCSAAFALVSYGQANGSEIARQWPDLDSRGREFFVRVMANIMDETGLDRDGAAELAENEARQLLEEGRLEQVMPACMLMLDASGL